MRQQTYLVQRQTILRLIPDDATNIRGGCGYFATAPDVIRKIILSDVTVGTSTFSWYSSHSSTVSSAWRARTTGSGEVPSGAAAGSWRRPNPQSLRKSPPTRRDSAWRRSAGWLVPQRRCRGACEYLFCDSVVLSVFIGTKPKNRPIATDTMATATQMMMS